MNKNIPLLAGCFCSCYTHRMPHVSITKKPEESAIEVRAEIPVERVARYRAKALKELGNEVTIAGFRKGSIPEQVLIKQVGEAGVMERTASFAIAEELPIVLAKESIVAIETPRVSVTKLAAGNPIAFTALVTVMPEVKLPDYTTIARKENAKKEKVSVSDDEVSEVTVFLRRERAKIERIEKGVEPNTAHEEAQKLPPEELPAIDDVFAQSLGAKDSADLSTRMRENMEADKERRATEKTRLGIMDGIIEKVSIVVPAVLVERELDRMMEQLTEDIRQGGSTFDSYLKSVKKSVEDMRKEWRPLAEKHVKMRLILREIAIKESIVPDEARVAHELEHLKEHHPDVPEADLRLHIESALLPESVFSWIEKQ